MIIEPYRGKLIELHRRIRRPDIWAWEYDNSSFATDAIGFTQRWIYHKNSGEPYTEYVKRIYGVSMESRIGSYLFGPEWGESGKDGIIRFCGRVVVVLDHEIPTGWFSQLPLS